MSESSLSPRVLMRRGIVARRRALPGVLTLAVSIVFASTSVAWAAMPPADTSAHAKEEPSRYWNDAKALLKRGAYRDALQSLDILLTITPDDPWAQLYHSLCELRLKSTSSIAEISPEALQGLRHRLQEESQEQRRTAARQKVIDRQVQQEQARWDRELVTMQRQAEREEHIKRQLAQSEAIHQAQAERAQTRALAQQQSVRQAQVPPAGGVGGSEGAQVSQSVGETQAVSGTNQPTSTPATPTGSSTGPATSPSPTETGPVTELPSPSAGQRAVELAPVVVPTGPGEAGPQPSSEAALTPSLMGRAAPPKGAVQINARQMSVSPDQRIAVAEGDVEVVFENALLTCDHLTLYTDTKDAYAEGRVRLEQGNQVFRGEMVHYNFETRKGRFLQGTVSAPPWHEHGRTVEHIAEGVYEVTPGYITSCELEPPHFKLFGRRAIVFSDDKVAQMRNVALFVEQVPFLYFPWLSIADRQSPFFILPGKKKPWREFVLSGYRFELPNGQKGTIRLDWRRTFLWAAGLDYQLENDQFGRGLLKLYYNPHKNLLRPKSDLPKGAADKRYRILWRHRWQPMPDTTVVTDLQKFSDADFRRELLFREEYTKDDSPESFISVTKNDPDFTLTGQVKKRVNRFQTVTEAIPDFKIDVRPQRISDTQFFSETSFNVSNLQTKTANSDQDTDVIRVDWFQQLKYALSLFAPIEVTPRAGLRETFYTKDKQGGIERTQGDRNLFSGQFSMGTDASLKLFRIFPVTAHMFGLDINWLRHIVTPTVSYNYIHRPTVSNDLLNFATASTPTSQITFGLENKLQTKRAGVDGKMKNVDLARLLTSIPYTFRGVGNKQGGRLGDLACDLETYPWPWMRLESDWTVPSHFMKKVARNQRVPSWNLDMVVVGGRNQPEAINAPKLPRPVPDTQAAGGSEIQAPSIQGYQAGSRGALASLLMPQGQWYLGFGHRFSANDKTESVIQYDWRLSDKWEISTFHRFTWKETASTTNGTAKRFNNLRETQYVLRRDLHDWIGELVYRVDREFGEELFFTLTLKAYPQMPIELQDSYHQPKLGSQSSPFSPIRVQ